MTEPLLLARHHIHDSHWNDLIRESTHPVAYAYTWYLDRVAPHWQALVFSGPHGYRIVMPLPVRKKWGFSLIYQPFFCQFLGIYAREELTPSEGNALFQALHRHFRYISSYAFHPGDTVLLSRYFAEKRDPGLTYRILSTHWLNLKDSYPTLTSKYTQDRKKNMERARRTGWQRTESHDPDPLIALFRQHHAGRIGGGVAESAYKLLRELASQLLAMNKAHLFYATLNGEIQAGILLLETDGQSIYIFNAATPAGRKGNARSWLLDGYFQEKAGDLTCFDFESPELESIRSFYKSFGAEEKSFFVLQKNKLPFPLRQLQTWRKRWFTAT